MAIGEGDKTLSPLSPWGGEGKRRAVLAASIVLAFVAGALFALDHAYPPDARAAADLSVEVDDRHGRPLAIFLNHGDKFRLPATPEQVSPLFLDLLLAYEDQRFYSHPGVDPLAALRAAGQNLAAGRVVSGASTLTMQAARLLHPAPRGWRAKLAQTVRALQLEARYDKRSILSFYLTLAPYGGNVEGVRAAAWTWFGKGADALTPGEAALLAALPRAPEALRPDRADPAALKAARDLVIDRGAALGALSPALAAEAKAEPLPSLRRPPPMAAPHAARRLAVAAVRVGKATVRSSLDPALQAAAERALRDAMAEQGPHVGAAALVVENRSRKVRAYVGAPDALDADRLGAVDMVQASRSPGSALKPFVYGAAFSLGLLHPETLVADASTRFGGYAPQNFDRGFHGDMTVAEALQRSLNVPAVLALQKVGAQRFVDAMGRAGARLALPRGDVAAGLPVALGGVGVTLWDLAGLYAALANGGRPAPLILREDSRPPDDNPPDSGGLVAMTTPEAARAVLRILEGTPPPEGWTFGAQSALTGRIALKTGTSFGFRDAWAFGVSATHTVGVWVGRADGTPTPGRYGAVAAAPLVYHLFDLLPPPETPPSGVGALPGWDGGPAAMLRRASAGPVAAGTAFAPRDPLRLVFPTPGVSAERRDGAPLVLEARGGKRPLLWLVDGKPLARGGALTRTALWTPDGPGHARVTVMDAAGAAASVVVEVR